MPQVKGTIPSMVDGISQQEPVLRRITQGELQENMLSSPVDGLQKRPGTEHVGQLFTLDNALPFIHFVNQGTANRYIFVVDDWEENPRVFTLAGAELATPVLNGSVFTHFAQGAGVSPRGSFLAVDSAQWTVILHRDLDNPLDPFTSGTLTGSRQLFTDLPGSPTNGDIYRITGSAESNFRSYFVRYDSSLGSWVEDRQQGIEHTVDVNSLTTFHNDGGTLRWGSVVPGSRPAGDETSVPHPGFTDSTISDVFFWRNRLGVLSGDKVILSRAGLEQTAATAQLELSFHAETALDVLDSDPIEVGARGRKGTLLSHALPFSNTLLLFSGTSQFEVNSAGLLTPSSVAIDSSSSYAASPLVKPVAMGANAYFAVERGTGTQKFTSIREYFVQEGVVSTEAADITGHCPRYIPGNVFLMEEALSEDMLFLASPDEPDALYVYKQFWADGEKLQSSWSKWTFGPATVIHACRVIDGQLYLALERAGSIHLEVMDLDPSNAQSKLSYHCHLDGKVRLTGTYDAGNDWTTWTLPYEPSGTVQVVLSSDFGTSEGVVLQGVTQPTTTTVRASGDYSAGDAYLGEQYSARYQFSEQFHRDRDGNPKSGSLKLNFMEVRYADAGYFRAEVTPHKRQTYTYLHTGREVGSTFTLGAPSIQSGAFRFPIMSSSQGLTVEIVNDSHLPSSFLSAEWTGLFLTQRGGR